MRGNGGKYFLSKSDTLEPTTYTSCGNQINMGSQKEIIHREENYLQGYGEKIWGKGQTELSFL